ncbi:CheR family methyltransferase [Bacillus sp. Au-Bac7]|uniref:CheR family methyltransferase n=1 Tax=Bacillus sp. Au-Bac7 TaxID=2906458 RepID=UPI001E5D9B71|nr:CheR family methyltransferase [Bacillus sp. Au-Bac7]MCE4048522.1 PAS domain-containing protein [Bacillus sp. Au-Bac7]
MTENISTHSSEHTDRMNDYYVVGIGASAGGLEAIEQFFANMPSNTGMVFVIVQHLSSKYKSFMPELLAKKTNMNILRAAKGMQLVPNTIYLNPPNQFLTIKEGVFELEEYEKDKHYNFPIDTFFRSLAYEKQQKAISIVFSGNGTDGTEGIQIIKENGGIVFVQEKDTAKFHNMPKSAITSGVADYVEAPSDIPVIIQTITDPSSLNYSEESLKHIFNILLKKTGINFSYYKKSSVLRRIERRMKVIKDPQHSLDAYRDYLFKVPEEIDLLQKDLLIGVTQFFRDPEAFKEIEKLIPELVERKIKNGEEEIRVWTVGCSTGQEAYTMAMLIDQYIETIEDSIDFRIFATDVDKDSIKTASQGIYDSELLSEIPSYIKEKYFEPAGEKYQVKKTIRKKIVFAPHNISKDSPFVNIDLISCRNMMIYFQPELQQRILSLFHFSLIEDGILFLGSSETVGKLSGFFEPIHSKWKIYRNKQSDKWDLKEPAIHSKTKAKETTNSDVHVPTTFFDALPGRKVDLLYQKLVNDFINPCIILNEQNEVVLTSKKANRFLSVPIGETNYSIFKMVPAHLSVIIGTGLKKLRENESEVTYKNVLLVIDKEEKYFDLTIKRFLDKDALSILLFHEEEESKGIISSPIYFDHDSTISERVIDLEQELFYTQQNLQTTIEELETSNEELQSTNEELIASNEELQSTNEELQSVNEELINVNNEYENKIAELTDLTNDLDNLLINTNIGTIFLDKGFNIKLFTPEVQKIVNVLDMDIGRPLFHISHNLEYGSLLEDAKEVLKTTSKVEREIRSYDGNWYGMKAMPYRTSDNIVDGVVITFTDITEIKTYNQKLSLTSSVIEQSPTSIIITDKAGRIEYTNERFKLQTKQELDCIGLHILDVYEQYLNAEGFLAVWEAIKVGNDWEGNITYRLDDGIERWENVSFHPIKDSYGNLVNILRTSEDITENKKSEAMLKKSEMLSAVGQLAAGIAHEIRNPLTSLKGFLQLMMQSNTYNKEYTEVMFSEFNRLELIISEFLVLARPQAVAFKEQQIEGILEDVNVLLSTQAILKNISLALDYELNMPPVYCNEKELKQLFINMIKNAMEAMDSEGAISISARMETEGQLLVKVSDQGKGIPKEQLERMGEPFYTTKEKGTGLGLMISQKIIDNHKGTLTFHSEVGVGTTVEMRFPVK